MICWKYGGWTQYMIISLKCFGVVWCVQEEEDYSEVMQDPAFLQSVLENLPGVDPNSEAIKDAMKTLTSNTPKDKDKDQSKKEGKK